MRRLLERRTDWEPRFLEGTARELEELFGGRLPQLPGREPTFLVDLHPGLRKTLRDLLERIGQSLTAKTPGARPPGADEAFSRFEESLEALLTTIIERERRLGILNLFWLAHSRDAAELIQELFGRPGAPAGLKYRIHPLVQGSYRNALTRLWARARGRPDQLIQRHLGADYNTSLLDAVVDDQLPLTELSAAQLNFAQVLVEGNRRFRLTFLEFREVLNLARERLREARERREARLVELLRRTFPGLKPEQTEDERVLPRVLFSARILAALLAGAPAPQRSAKGGKARPWGEVVADFLDFTQAVKRFEALDALRREVRLVGAREGGDARAAYDAGRLYRFHPGAEVVTLAWKITILFADLRGFTRASEGSVSERELTDHLYDVFDPLAAIVERYQGRIDKFTGDGVMITFGFDGVGPHDEENALRTALAIQALMAQLRAERRTRFEMGISVHTGRAQVAHFILDGEGMDRTVIGRNVNIAGRLSGSGKTQASAFDEAAAAPGAEAEVTVDEDGTLYNTGIVVSQDTVEALLQRVDAESWQDGQRRGFRFADAELGKKVLLEYVGDAKFKGVGRAIAIYRLGLEEARSDGASQRGTAQ